MLLLGAYLLIGIARSLAVPPGYNVDEWARMPYILRQAACWREGVNSRSLECWQAGHYRGNPAYYLLLSIPETFALESPEAIQYLIARITTSVLGLVTLGIAWLTFRELLPSNSLWAIGITSAVGLNQSFGDIFSGVNSDASATLAVGLLIYALARLERRRVNLAGLLLLVAGILACVNSSGSALWLGLPIAIVWALLKTWRSVGRWLALAMAAAVGLAFALPIGLVEWTTPQYWFDAGQTEILGAADRLAADGPLGPHTIVVQQSSEDRAPEEVQYLPDAIARRLAGKTITFGGWMLAPAGEIVEGPRWDDGAQRVSPTVVGAGHWQFVAMQAQVSSGATSGAIYLTLPPSESPVEFDGLVVAEGAYPTDAPPKFDSARGYEGTWGGLRFTNLLLNPSVEETWPTLRETGLPRDFVAYNGRLRSLLAWQRTAQAYPAILNWLFVGFWSGFSGIYPGLKTVALIPFLLLTIVGIAGSVRIALRSNNGDLRHIVRFFAPPAILVWGTIVLRADLWPNLPTVLSFAGARYGVTAIVPSMALIVLGALGWLPPRLHRPALALLALGLWFTSIHILLSVQIPFYACWQITPDVARCLTSLR